MNEMMLGVFSKNKDIVTNDINDLISSTALWAFNNTNGWYSNKFSSEITWFDNSKLNVDKIKEVGASFTCYYNSPANCLGTVFLIAEFTDNTSIAVGVSDSWTDSGQLQTLATQSGSSKVGNVVNKFINIVLPENKRFKAIGISSRYYSGYPASTRGIKNISIKY